jgi:hypothetical protein
LRRSRAAAEPIAFSYRISRTILAESIVHEQIDLSEVLLFATLQEGVQSVELRAVRPIDDSLKLE